MRTYKLLSHTADIRMKVEADSLPELFVVAVEGMNSILKTRNVKREAKNKITVEMRALDEAALLVDFMNEALYQSQTNREIYTEVKFLEFSETALKAEIYGQKVEEFDEDIKAITYHEAKIVKNEKGNYETIIVFDV